MGHLFPTHRQHQNVGIQFMLRAFTFRAQNVSSCFGILAYVSDGLFGRKFAWHIKEGIIIDLQPPYVCILSEMLDIVMSESQEDEDLRQQLSSLRKELQTIRMVDEFARYAKTERKINKLKMQLDDKCKKRFQPATISMHFCSKREM